MYFFNLFRILSLDTCSRRDKIVEFKHVWLFHGEKSKGHTELLRDISNHTNHIAKGLTQQQGCYGWPITVTTHVYYSVPAFASGVYTKGWKLNNLSQWL